MAKVIFKAPEGVTPENIETGDTFDLVCTFKVEPSGKVCLVMMGDAEMPGYNSKPESRRDYSDEKEAMDGMRDTGNPTSDGY